MFLPSMELLSSPINLRLGACCRLFCNASRSCVSVAPSARSYACCADLSGRASSCRSHSAGWRSKLGDERIVRPLNISRVGTSRKGLKERQKPIPSCLHYELQSFSGCASCCHEPFATTSKSERSVGWASASAQKSTDDTGAYEKAVG